MGNFVLRAVVSILMFGEVTESTMFSQSTPIRYIYVGAGGCDSDDPTCYEPDGTNLITTCSLDSDGKLEIVDTTSGIRDPAWLLQHPSLSVLYATETGGSGVWSLSVNRTNATATPSLKIGSYVATGDAPVYLSFDITNQFIFVANYNGGSLSAVSLDSDGQVDVLSSQVQHYGHGVNPERQEAPHVHGLFVTPKGDSSTESIVYAMDLGMKNMHISFICFLKQHSHKI
jgi:6-phosphogluconolactonase (cycloisomerase 2 family)